VVRLFFASFTNARARELLARKTRWLKQQLPGGIKWVDPDNFHITLKFLGEVGEDEASELREKIEKEELDLEDFSYKYQGLETFPHVNNPRVIVTPVELGGEKIKEVHNFIENICTDMGFEAETRSFKPHLTLGRVKDDDLKDEVSSFFSELEDPYVVNVLDHMEKFSLMESNLTPDGPEYMEVFSKKLQ